MDKGKPEPFSVGAVEEVGRTFGKVYSVMPDVMSIEQVADILHASLDSVRRISRVELPVYRGPGKRLLYLREDILRYVRGRRIVSPAIDI